MTGTPESGVESPSKFMMGVEAVAENEEVYDEALRNAFGIEPEDTTEDSGVDDPAEPVDTTVDSLIDTEDDPDAESDTTSQGSQDQGGEEEPEDVATGVQGVDFASLFEQRYGRKPERDEYDGLLALADWANNLTPEQQEAINAALSPPPGGSRVGQVQVPPPELDPLVEQYGEDDPLVQRMRTQEAELAELRERYQSNFQQEAQQKTVVGIEAGTEAFRAQIELDDAELERLQGAVIKAGIFPALVQQTRGNVEVAMQRALETAYWQDETFREREIQKRIAARSETQQQHKQRQTKAASVTGTGGNGASRTEAPAKNSDPWANVAQGIREAQNNGVPVN